MIAIDEPISLHLDKPFGGDGTLKVFFTSNKFEDLMGQVTLNVMTEQEYNDFTYNNRLLATLTFWRITNAQLTKKISAVSQSSMST